MPDCADLWHNIAQTLMEQGRIPEAVATGDHVLKLWPLDAGVFMSRRELLKDCIYKGECSAYSFEEGQWFLKQGICAPVMGHNHPGYG